MKYHVLIPLWTAVLCQDLSLLDALDNTDDSKPREYNTPRLTVFNILQKACYSHFFPKSKATSAGNLISILIYVCLYVNQSI